MGKMYENSTRVKKAVLDLKKHPTINVPEATEMGGFTNDEAKYKYIQIRTHQRDTRPSTAIHNKGVPLEVYTKSLESNILSMLGGVK